MATLQTNPDAVPDDVVEWTRELNVSELGRVGYINIGFTLWDETSTSVPYVKEGTIIEINNSLYVEGSNIALNTTGQTVDAINWVIYKVSGSTATAYLESTAPAASNYDVAKGGFYDGSGNRWTGHYMYVSPAGTAYSNKGFLDYAGGAMIKYRIDDEFDDYVIDGKLDVKETLNVDGNTVLKGTTNLQGAVDCDSTLNVDGNSTFSTSIHSGTATFDGEILPDVNTISNWVIGAGGAQLIPRGIFQIVNAGANPANVEQYNGGSWRLSAVTASLIGSRGISSGIEGSVRITSVLGTTIYYLKL